MDIKKMITYWVFTLLLCYGFITQTNGLFSMRGIPHGLPSSSDSNLLIENYVKQNGYPFELHYVITQDGYILALHRIPSNNQNRTTQNRTQRAVLIMHGLLGSSADWLLTGKNRSIAFLLADNGYDVWLGNARGSTNSKNHTTFSIQSAQFWDFSWHEIGIFDTAAMIDYILAKTGQKQLFYIGFSQGTTQFWVLMSLRPHYNKKIKLMSALAPVAYQGHTKGLLKLASFIATFFKELYNYIGYFEVLSNTPIQKLITYFLCQEGMVTQPFCEIILFSIGGFSDEIDHEHLANYLQFSPAGCSFKQLVHYAMNIDDPGHFRAYDYGALRNLRKYRQFVPPEYPIARITAPVILYNGLNDFLADPKDVDILNRKLPNILEKYTVMLKRLNHFDFVYGLHVRELVYDHLIEKMNLIP